jgi:hypothetical protein
MVPSEVPDVRESRHFYFGLTVAGIPAFLRWIHQVLGGGTSLWNQMIRTGAELVASVNLLIALIRATDKYLLSEFQ